MFYRPEEGHGLPHDPLSALVMPRPIGWISSMDAEGHVNLAPFALFNIVAYQPPHVMFAPTGQQSGRFKDSLNNVEATHEFVANMATWALRDVVWKTSIPAPPNADEFELTGLTPIPSTLVKPPRVKESPVHLECRHVQTVRLPHEDANNANHIVIGKVVGIHIADSVIVDGIVDEMRLEPMARLGYLNYTRLTEVHDKPFPTWPPEGDQD
ncbi:MAG: flavin reductase family protein [Gammaproteobacteria bacterium]